MGRRVHLAAARARERLTRRVALRMSDPRMSDPRMSDRRAVRRFATARNAAVWLIAAISATFATSCRPGDEHGASRDAARGIGGTTGSAQDVDVRIRVRGDIVLAGTLARPEGAARQQVPVVVLIGGSGPQDRDGSRVELAGYQPFRDLAASLAASGIASLRLDDRGTGASTGRFDEATTLEFADDIAPSSKITRGIVHSRVANKDEFRNLLSGRHDTGKDSDHNYQATLNDMLTNIVSRSRHNDHEGFDRQQPEQIPQSPSPFQYDAVRPRSL